MIPPEMRAPERVMRKPRWWGRAHSDCQVGIAIAWLGNGRTVGERESGSYWK